MSFTSSFTLKSFLISYINKSSIVLSTRLDKTIKALINSYSKKEETSYSTSRIINYLNKLRVVYFFRRLDYKDSNKAKELKSKYFFYLITKSLLISFRTFT